MTEKGNEKDYRNVLNSVCEMIKDAYELEVKDREVRIYAKARFDEVTETDIAIEQVLISRTSRIMPEARFLTEELKPGTGLSDGTWVIDPISGTCNYTHGMDTYGIQCALYDNGDFQACAIYLPFADEMFTAVKGEGAWLNGKEINPDSREIARCIISLGDYIEKDESARSRAGEIIENCAGRIQKIRMFGSAGIDFSYAACGRTDGCVTFSNDIWDIAPGLLLCSEAGLVITDLNGNEYKEGADGAAVFSDRKLVDVCLPK